MQITVRPKRKTIRLIAWVIGFIIITSIIISIIGPRFINQTIKTNKPNMQQSGQQHNVEDAKESIRLYYQWLSENNATELSNNGYVDAANAINNSWLSIMGFSVNPNITPDIQEMPESVGSYAGSALYDISSFYTVKPTNTIQSNVTGTRGYTGWVYYDIADGKWCIIDPLIPTSVQAADSNVVQRISQDSKVNVKTISVGALSNPWWSWAKLDVSIDTSYAPYDTQVQTRLDKYDDGITVKIPEIFDNKTILTRMRTQQSQPTNQENQSNQTQPTTPTDNQTQPTTPTNNNQQQSTEPVVTFDETITGVHNGSIIIYRGDTENFIIDKIGQQSLNLDGIPYPIQVVTPTETILPVWSLNMDE